MRCSLLGLALAGLWSLACTGTQSSDAPGALGASGDTERVIATIDGNEITMAELDTWIKEDWLRDQLEGEGAAKVHEFRSERLNRMIDERLLEAEARTRGVDPDTLLQEAADNAPGPSEEQVSAFFSQNQARLQDATLEQIAPRIREHLQQQNQQQAVLAFVASLRERSAVKVEFEPPRVEVAAIGPALGPEVAPVTVVEFSDFQCPFCSRAAPVLKQLRERYPEKVRVVYRHFPLDSIHPHARPAAEASMCAGEQDRFWEFHDLLFANSKALSDDDLAGYAEQLSLDAEVFQACIAEGRFRDAVQQDLDDGRRAGVSGTPSFFVNGRMLGGAVPLEEFVKVIESELQRQGGAAS